MLYIPDLQTDLFLSRPFTSLTSLPQPTMSLCLIFKHKELSQSTYQTFLLWGLFAFHIIAFFLENAVFSGQKGQD